MDKLEQTKKELERLKDELIANNEGTMFEQGRISAFEDAILFINSLQVVEEPVSEGIDEDDSFDELLQELYIKYNKEVSIEKLLDIASNFVKWQKQQMTKESVKAKIVGIKKNILTGSYGFAEIEGNFKEGDEFKVVIIKED